MSIMYEVDLDPETGMELDDFDAAYAVPFGHEDFEALGIKPEKPTAARPGSEDKVLTLAARYAAGLPLWHEDDCYDHGPGEIDLMGQRVER